MKKFLLLLLMSMLVFVNFGCGSKGGDEENKDLGKIYKIIFDSDKKEIIADGKTEVTFSFKVVDKENNELKNKNVKIYVNGSYLESSKFSTSESGNYKFYAECEGIKSEDILITAIKQLEVIIPDTTKVLSSNEKIKIEDYNLENGIIQLSAVNLEETGIKAGDVVVSGITSKSPKGFLRKVKSIEEKDGKIFINSEKAEITDAITQGIIKFNVDLKKENLEKGETRYGNVKLLNNKRYDNNYGYEFILDVDETITTESGDKIRVQGNVSINPGIDLEIEVDLKLIKKIEFGTRCKMGGTLIVSGNGEEYWDKEIVLYTFYFEPIVVDIGGVPVVFRPSIDVVVGTNGKIKGDFKLSSSTEVVSSYYIGYERGKGWKGDEGKFEKDFTFSEPIVNATLESKVYGGADLKISLYDENIAKIGGQLNTYVRIDADINKKPWWIIYGGVEADLYWGVFGLNYSKTYDIAETEIVSAKYYSEDGEGIYDPDYGKEKGWAKSILLKRDIGFGETNVESVFAAVSNQTDDGIISVGSSNSIFEVNGIIASFDKKGNRKWLKGIENKEKSISIKDITEANDGYIIVGKSFAGFIAKIDREGKRIWAKEFDFNWQNDHDILASYGGITEVIKIKENTYLFKMGNLLATIDENGNILKKTLFKLKELKEGSDDDWAYGLDINDIKPLGDGSFVFCAGLAYFSSAEIVKMDSELNIVWNKSFMLGQKNEAYSELAEGTSIAVTAEKEFYITFNGVKRGNLYTGIAKLDKDGNQKWIKVFNIYSDSEYEYIYGLNANTLKNGDVILSGSSKSINFNNYKALMIRISDKGIYQWGKEISPKIKDGESDILSTKTVGFGETKEREDGKGIYVSGFIYNEGKNMAGSPKNEKTPCIFMFNETGEIEEKGENSDKIIISNFNKILYEDEYYIDYEHYYTLQNTECELKTQENIDWEEVEYKIEEKRF